MLHGNPLENEGEVLLVLKNSGGTVTRFKGPSDRHRLARIVGGVLLASIALNTASARAQFPTAPPFSTPPSIAPSTASPSSGLPATQPPAIQSFPSTSRSDQPGSTFQPGSAFERSRQVEVRSSPSSSAGTRIPVPAELQRLLERGGVPDSLDQLRLLEQQQKRVAARVADCTVSVKIGASQGCGVIITGTGYIVTAAHVAMRPNKAARVSLSNGRVVRATTLGMNREVDAGLMLIDPGQNGGDPWPHASLGTSEGIVPGMWCIAMGHPGGYDQARGSVIRVGRLLQVRNDALVSDCALIGGDSGGPLFNIAGELIAVHSRIGNEVSINLHVPIDHYDHSWKRMAKAESWGFLPNFKPSLGVRGNHETPRARIIVVNEGSPADEAGLKPNDVIEQFGEKGITDFQSLKDAVAETMPGERVPIWLLRDGQRKRLVVLIGRT